MATETLGHAYADTRMLALNLRMYVACFMHAYAHTGMHTHARISETMKDKFLCNKAEVWSESHIVWEPFQTPNFFNIKSNTWYLFKTHIKS